MPRELPSGLSDRHRDALTQFFAGLITAGQLSERLALGESGRERAKPPLLRHQPTLVEPLNPQVAP